MKNIILLKSRNTLINRILLKVIQYSPVVTAGIAEELGMRIHKDFDKILNAILRKIGFDKVLQQEPELMSA